MPGHPVLHGPSSARTAPTASPAPHRGHRARHRAPCSRPGNPSHWEKASLRNHPRAEGWQMCPLGPQARHGPSNYFGAALQGHGSWAARKRRTACPGTRRSYAKNVHARGWPPARPCRGTSPTSGLPAAPVTPGLVPGNRVGAVPRAQQPPAGGNHGPCGAHSTWGGTWSIAALGQNKAQQGTGNRGPGGG